MCVDLIRRFRFLGLVFALLMTGGMSSADDDGGERRTLLVFSVPWCLACERMDQDVWVDPDLVAFLQEGYALVRIGEEELEEAMEQYTVSGFPTLVLIEDGEEIGRKRGYVDAGQLRDWFENPSMGVEVGDPWAMPIGAVHDQAVELLLEERLEEAAQMLVAFWVRSASSREMTDTLRWLRRDRYPNMLAHVAGDPRGLAHVQELMLAFDEDGPDEIDDARLIQDWIVLCGVLGDEERLDRWIDERLRSMRGVEVLSGQRRVFDRLVELERWSDAGQIASERMWERWLARVKNELVGDPASDAAPERVIQNEQREARGKLDVYVKALHASGRHDDAAELSSQY
jgi:hypothetical protein